jgi:hypothetical protein
MVLYRDGGTCWVTDHATQSFTLFIPDFTCQYYNLRLQTNSSHTNCVEYRKLARRADSRTVPYSWRS